MLYKERKKGEQSVTTTTTKKGNESYLCVEGVGSRGDLLCSRGCWSSRGFYTATERMEMKMMLEFWRQNSEAKMFPFPTDTFEFKDSYLISNPKLLLCLSSPSFCASSKICAHKKGERRHFARRRRL